MGNDEEARIVQLYRDHNRYMVAGDTKKLGVLLDANFHLVHMTGMVQSKQKWLQDIDTKQMNYFSSTEENVEVQMKNDHQADLIGQSRVDASIHGGRNIWPLKLTLHVEKFADDWKIMNIDAAMY
ncbi:nuclear transport factor 2 family protein [Pediococcus parvulus]